MRKDDINKNKKSIYRHGEEEKSITDKHAPNLKALGKELLPVFHAYKNKAEKYITKEKISNLYYTILSILLVGAFFWGFFAFFGYILKNWGK